MMRMVTLIMSLFVINKRSLFDSLNCIESEANQQRKSGDRDSEGVFGYDDGSEN